MKEITQVTVPGTTVVIAIMLTIEGQYNVTRSAQVNIANKTDVVFDDKAEARHFANLLWTSVVAHRNAQTDRMDKQAHADFERAQEENAYINEMRLD